MIGNPSDTAMLNYADSIIDVINLRKKYNVIFFIKLFKGMLLKGLKKCLIFF